MAAVSYWLPVCVVDQHTDTANKDSSYEAELKVPNDNRDFGSGFPYYTG